MMFPADIWRTRIVTIPIAFMNYSGIFIKVRFTSMFSVPVYSDTMVTQMSKEDFKVVSVSLHRIKDKELIERLAECRNVTEKIRSVLSKHFKVSKEEK